MKLDPHATQSNETIAQAHVRVIDALYALGQFDEASAALRAALTADPGFSDCPDYGIIERALRAKGVLTQ